MEGSIPVCQDNVSSLNIPRNNVVVVFEIYLSSYLMHISVVDVLLLVNWTKWVVLRFSESKFASNHIFIRLKTMLILFCSLLAFGLVISILALNLLGLKWFCSIDFSDAKVPNVNACYEIWHPLIYSRITSIKSLVLGPDPGLTSWESTVQLCFTDSAYVVAIITWHIIRA